MYDETFKLLKKMALDKLSGDETPEYWTGYMRGLRRRHEGKGFCSLEEHHQWLTDSGNRTSNLRSLGYRDGYGCTKNNGDCMTCEYVNHYGLDCNLKSMGLKKKLLRFKKKNPS